MLKTLGIRRSLFIQILRCGFSSSGVFTMDGMYDCALHLIALVLSLAVLRRPGNSKHIGT